MIREINEEDRSYLYSIIKREFNFIYDKDSSFSNWLIYVENDKIIGFINFDTIYERAELEYIYVEKEYRRKNIATKLLESMWKILEKKDIHSITLEVNCNNAAAIKFYEKNGFEKVSVREKYYGNEDAFLMIKK
jgi:ribosomal-protein-alanine N-acetyltransferase